MHQIFGIFAAGMAIGGTWTFGDRKILFSGKADDIRLGHIKQRPDDGETGPFKFCNRRECIEVALVDERHQHGFYQVIAMMSVGDFIAAEFQCLIVQRTLANRGSFRDVGRR